MTVKVRKLCDSCLVLAGVWKGGLRAHKEGVWKKVGESKSKWDSDSICIWQFEFERGRSKVGWKLELRLLGPVFGLTLRSKVSDGDRLVPSIVLPMYCLCTYICYNMYGHFSCIFPHLTQVSISNLDSENVISKAKFDTLSNGAEMIFKSWQEMSSLVVCDLQLFQIL